MAAADGAAEAAAATAVADINYENTYSLNKTELIKEAKVFGFAWMGDGTTILS